MSFEVFYLLFGGFILGIVSIFILNKIVFGSFVEEEPTRKIEGRLIFYKDEWEKLPIEKRIFVDIAIKKEDGGWLAIGVYDDKREIVSIPEEHYFRLLNIKRISELKNLNWTFKTKDGQTNTTTSKIDFLN